jgi:hypothetical protein
MNILFIYSYNGKSADNLTKLRCVLFMAMVSKSLRLQPENLQPTEQAAKYHARRVHLQVCQWKTLDLNILEANNWGWQLNEDQLRPIMTDIERAPEWLLKFICCNCNPLSKNACSSRVCSCKKNGLPCIAACGKCYGELCTNPNPNILARCDSDSDDDDDDNADDDDADDDDADNDFCRNIFDLFD